MIRRQKIIDALRLKLDDAEIQSIVIVWEKWIGKSTFLRDLEADGFFWDEWLYTYIYLEKWAVIDYELLKKSTLTIIDTEETMDQTFWETTISLLPPWHRLILTSDIPLSIEGVAHVHVGIISFREYSDSKGYPIDIGKVLSGDIEIDKLNELRNTYMERWWFPMHLTHPETIHEDYMKKRAIIEWEVFDKEKEILLEFMRTIAMNIGNLFKADQIAKLLGISRRKVNKYTEILLKHGILQAVWPWWPNPATETTRHVKLYFRDLSFVKILLWDTYNQWTLKHGAIENFVFLELERKLDDTHSISYYRKKSWAEINFILENNTTGTVTPVEVTLRETEAISQVFRTFDSDYHEKIERFMLVNNAYGWKKDINGIPLIILPHVAI